MGPPPRAVLPDHRIPEISTIPPTMPARSERTLSDSTRVGAEGSRGSVKSREKKSTKTPPWHDINCIYHEQSDLCLRDAGAWEQALHDLLWDHHAPIHAEKKQRRYNIETPDRVLLYNILRDLKSKSRRLGEDEYANICRILSKYKVPSDR